MFVQSCPNCVRDLRLADDVRGKRVKCPKCGTVFAADAAPESRRERPAPAKRPPPPDEDFEVLDDEPAPKPVKKKRKPAIESWGTIFRQAGIAIGVGFALGLLLNAVAHPFVTKKNIDMPAYVRFFFLPFVLSMSSLGLAGFYGNWKWINWQGKSPWYRFFAGNSWIDMLGPETARYIRCVLAWVFAVIVVGVSLAPIVMPGRPAPNPLPEWPGQKIVSIDDALTNLSSSDFIVQAGAFDALITAAPDDARRAEVIAAAEKHFTDKNFVIRGKACQVIGTWGTSAHVPQLLALLSQKDLQGRDGVIEALGKLGDDRAIEPIGKFVSDPFSRGPALTALRRFGAKAERVVLPHLGNRDSFVRSAVCDFLGDVGTKDCIPALERASQDPDFFVANAAKKALAAVKGRN